MKQLLLTLERLTLERKRERATHASVGSNKKLPLNEEGIKMLKKQLTDELSESMNSKMDLSQNNDPVKNAFEVDSSSRTME